jgi:hypothetical protein
LELSEWAIAAADYAGADNPLQKQGFDAAYSAGG